VRTGLVPLRQYPTICRGRAEKSWPLRLANNLVNAWTCDLQNKELEC
jgi:hypothetical protein